MEFEKYPLNGMQDTAKKVLCSSRKVPFVIDRSPPNLFQLKVMLLCHQVTET